METIKWSYFQYRKGYDYPIFIRLADHHLGPKLNHLLEEVGFNLLTALECKKINLHRPNTRILTASEASPRLLQQINGSNLLDAYGLETLALHLGTPVYTYRKVAMFAMPSNKTLWDLWINPEISETNQMVGLRVTLTRFLSQSLAELGVLSYWGTVKDETVIIMKQGQSFGEAVLIDQSKKMIFSNGGEVKLNSHLKLIRKDKEFKAGYQMTREDLISFLSVSTCLLSFQGLTHPMKKAIFELSLKASGACAVSENAMNL